MNNKLWQKCVDFHGHECPGLAIGFRASLAAIDKLGLDFSADEEVVCVTENDACGVDAVQVTTGCTIGKGNLIYRGTGKMAFSFFDRKNHKSIRIILKPLPVELNKKDCQEFILSAPIEQVFNFNIPKFPLPNKAQLFDTVICEICGEGAPEYKMRLQDGKKVCLDCFKDYSRNLSV